MPDVSFTDLALVMAVAFVTPLVLGPAPPQPGALGRGRSRARHRRRARRCSAGSRPTRWSRIVAVVGLAFLLFLAGLELDLRRLRGPVLRLGLSGFAVSLGLAGLVGLASTPPAWSTTRSWPR